MFELVEFLWHAAWAIIVTFILPFYILFPLAPFAIIFVYYFPKSSFVVIWGLAVLNGYLETGCVASLLLVSTVTIIVYYICTHPERSYLLLQGYCPRIAKIIS